MRDHTGHRRREMLRLNPSLEATTNCDRLFRGIIQEVFYKEFTAHGGKFGQTYVDVQLVGIALPNLRKVPIALTKSNLTNGEDWAPERGDWVLIQFINGNVGEPVVTGYLFPYDDANAGLQPAIGEAPIGKSRYRRKCNGTSETIDKDGNRVVHIAGNESITINGTGTITVTGAATINVPAGATINGDVTINGELQTNGNITARDNVRDQNGVKSMAGMRTAYNNHTHNHPTDGVTIPATNSTM